MPPGAPSSCSQAAGDRPEPAAAPSDPQSINPSRSASATSLARARASVVTATHGSSTVTVTACSQPPACCHGRPPGT